MGCCTEHRWVLGSPSLRRQVGSCRNGVFAENFTTEYKFSAWKDLGDIYQHTYKKPRETKSK